MQRKRDRLANASTTLRGPAGARPLRHHRLRPSASTAPTKISADIIEAAKQPCRQRLYDDPARAPRHFARFCFCKHDATLDSAIVIGLGIFRYQRLRTALKPLQNDTFVTHRR